METSLHYRSFAQKASLRDASFSSYLIPHTVDDSELSIFEAQKYFNENNDHHHPKECKISHPLPVINGTVNLDQHASDRCDISAVGRLSSVSSIDGYSKSHRVRSFHATPTASSEASWNSKTGLLSNPPGSIPVSLRNPPDEHEKKRAFKATKWFFCRKCPCSGKKSVQVEEAASETRAPMGLEDNNSKGIFRQSSKKMEDKDSSIQCQKTSVDSEDNVIINPQRIFSSENHLASNTPCHQRILGSGRPFGEGTEGFSFPILNPSSPVKLVLKGVPPQPTCSSSEDPPRDSLEVFQPLNESISRKSMEVQQRILVSNTDSGNDRERRGFTFPASPISRVTATDDDVASDASSDLFEIESFSTQTTSYAIPMYRRRDSLDDAPNFNARRLAASSGICTLYGRRSLDEPMTQSISTTDYCYEPSEASIDWSVTTAEGFDRASVTNFSVTASEIEDIAMIRRGWEKGRGGSDSGSGVESSKRKGNGLLLSCRQEKSVSVGPHPVKCVVAEALPFPLISTTFGHVSSRPPKPNKPSVTRSPSTRLSLAFAT